VAEGEKPVGEEEMSREEMLEAKIERLEDAVRTMRIGIRRLSTHIETAESRRLIKQLLEQTDGSLGS
jgi:hypothetical protein